MLLTTALLQVYELAAENALDPEREIDPDLIRCGRRQWTALRTVWDHFDLSTVCANYNPMEEPMDRKEYLEGDCPTIVLVQAGEVTAVYTKAEDNQAVVIDMDNVNMDQEQLQTFLEEELPGAGLSPAELVGVADLFEEPDGTEISITVDEPCEC